MYYFDIYPRHHQYDFGLDSNIYAIIDYKSDSFVSGKLKIVFDRNFPFGKLKNSLYQHFHLSFIFFNHKP